MKKQLYFIKALFADFEEDCAEHIKREKENRWSTMCDKNIGKTAVMRKITMLRQELLNLYKEIEKE